MTEPPPALRLELRLPAVLARAVTDQVRRRLRDEVTTVLGSVGLRPTFELAVVGPEPVPEAEEERDEVIALSVDGKRLALRDGELGRILAYAQGSPSSVPVPRGDGTGSWPDVLAGDETAGDVLSLLCRAVLGPQLAEVFPEHPLRELLEMGAPLPDRPTPPSPTDAQLEGLLAELPPPPFELAIRPDYLRELTRADDRVDLFPFMWEGLFYELGLPQPTARLRLDTSLRPRGFQLRTAAVTGVPSVGLAPGQLLVNDTSERLALMGIDAAPSSNPATRQPAAIVDADQREILEASGLTVWDPWGYLILSCASAVRDNAWRFMTLPVAETMLDRLGHAFPAVPASTREVVPREVLPRVLRELLFDQLSIRDLSGICEALARAWTDPDERDSDPVALVRHRQRHAIAHKLARGTSTVVVYLLDPSFESQDLSDPVAAVALRDAVTAELRHLPPLAQRPVILTQDAARRRVRKALRHQYPSMAVVGYGDLPPECNIQPVARITAS